MNQKDLDEDHYLSEDNFVCNKGRTETYILTMDSLNIYGPKQFKFGDSDKNYYFLIKSNAEVFKKELRRYYKRIQMLKDNPPKSKRELKKKIEEVLSSKPEFKRMEEILNISQQILKIKSLVGFNKWLVNNNLKYDTIVLNKNYIEIIITKSKLLTPILKLTAELKALPKCCGGKEFCIHLGAINSVILKGFSMDHWRVLSKYFALRFDEKLEEDSFGYLGQYYISYIKNPGSFEQPSARWGEILNKSKYFKKVGNFINSNTKANLDVYVSSQAYVKLYNK